MDIVLYCLAALIIIFLLVIIVRTLLVTPKNNIKADDTEVSFEKEKAVENFREINITEKQAVRFCNGGQLGFERLKVSDFKNGELLRVKYADTLLGIGIADCEKNHVAIKCILNYTEGDCR